MYDFQYFPTLRTERLQLDAITDGDVPALYEEFSDPEVTRYEDVETFTSQDDAARMLRFIRDRFDQRAGLRWAIRWREGPRTLMGTCGYNTWARNSFTGSIGYDLRRDMWNRGVITEAVRAIVDFGFREMGLNRIEADMMTGNAASARVLEKLGFTEEGVLRQRGVWKGGFHDLRLFSLLRQEWREWDAAGSA